MKWVAAGLVGASACLGASVAWGANFVNSAYPPRPAPPPASLEEPPPDEKPHTYSAARPDESSPSAGPRALSDSFSLTFSPLYLVLPMFKLTGEVHLVPHAGLAVLGGYGQTSLDVDNGDGTKSTFDANLYLAGAQLLYYPMRSFDGFELGAQFQYVYVDTQGKVADTSVTGIGGGFAIGPFLGYKWITRVGFTAMVQGGVQFVAIQAKASDQTGNSASASDSRILPLLDFGLGWTF